MNFILNERLRGFYLGDDSAWDDITFSFYDRILDFLKRNFPNVPVEELENAATDCLFEIRQKVIEERRRVDNEGKSENLSPEKIDQLKMEGCAKRIGFNAARGTFENWLKTIAYRKAIDSWRKINRRGEISIDEENFGELNDAGGGANDVEFLILMKEFKKLLFSALNENQRLYYRIWLNYGFDPSANDVREVFKNNLGKDLSDASISLIKHRFIRIIYLVLLRIECNAALLKDRFRRYINPSDNEDVFIDDMMHLIWQEFYADSGSREESRQKISPDLWRRWEKLRQRKNIQSEILVAAYGYFRAKSERPGFCRLIEIYASDNFGAKLRGLFFERKAAGENE